MGFAFVFIVFILLGGFLIVASTTLILIGMAGIFRKADIAWWVIFIPLYPTYILHEIALGEGKGIHFLKIFIPFYNIAWIFILNIRLARKFGQPAGFGIGLVFLPPIFYMLLGWGKKYRIPEPVFISAPV